MTEPMSRPENGGPAFPMLELNNQTGNIAEQHFGLTLRDYFAAKSMQAICSVLTKGIRPQDIGLMAEDAYNVADAMLKARQS